MKKQVNIKGKSNKPTAPMKRAKDSAISSKMGKDVVKALFNTRDSAAFVKAVKKRDSFDKANNIGSALLPNGKRLSTAVLDRGQYIPRKKNK